MLDIWIALRWLSIKLFQMSWPDGQTLAKVKSVDLLQREAVLAPVKPGCLLAGPAPTGRQAGVTPEVERVVCWSCSAEWRSKGRELGTIACSDYARPRGVNAVQVLQLTSLTGVKRANFINCIHRTQCDLSRDAPLRLALCGFFRNICGRAPRSHMCFGESRSPIFFWLSLDCVCLQSCDHAVLLASHCLLGGITLWPLSHPAAA